MINYDYIVAYSTQTGNTKKLASEIFAMLPGMDKDLKSIDEISNEAQTDIYFVGFWTDRGSCNGEVSEFLSGLHGKKIALFGTCGMGENEEYRKEVVDRTVKLIPRDNEFLGAFICQGKMPIAVRNRYEELYETSEEKETVAQLLFNFDRAMLHPNQEDYDKARLFVDAILSDLDIKREISSKWNL